MNDPNLLQPSPSIATATAVPPLPKFRSQNEHGQIVESVQPLPAIVTTETKHYVCSVRSASMHNRDGKKLPFVDGFLSTNLKHDKEYLDHEIDVLQNPYVRHATPEEIRAHAMKVDPRGTIKDEVRKEVEQEMKAKLEAEIRAEYEAKLAGGLLGHGGSSDGEKLAGTGKVDAVAALAAMRAGGAKITPVSTTDIAGAAANSGR